MTSDSTIVTSEQHLYQTIVQYDKTIVLPRKLATGNIDDYLFCYCPLVGILFEVLRINTNVNIALWEECVIILTNVENQQPVKENIISIIYYLILVIKISHFIFLFLQI